MNRSTSYQAVWRRTKRATDPVWRAKAQADRKTWEAANPEKKRAYQRTSYARNRSTYVARSRKQRQGLQSSAATWPIWAVYQSRNRAKAKGLPHTITATDIPVPDVCPILGVPFVFGGGQGHPHGPSVDRVDNSQGYVPGNVAIISYKANALKRGMTLQEVRAMLAYMEQHLGKDT